MRHIEIGPTTVLTIPGCWTAFVYNGFLYVLNGDRFICVEPR